jgi:hypothetical protein
MGKYYALVVLVVESSARCAHQQGIHTHSFDAHNQSLRHYAPSSRHAQTRRVFQPTCPSKCIYIYISIHIYMCVCIIYIYIACVCVLHILHVLMFAPSRLLHPWVAPCSPFFLATNIARLHGTRRGMGWRPTACEAVDTDHITAGDFWDFLSCAVLSVLLPDFLHKISCCLRGLAHSPGMSVFPKI